MRLTEKKEKNITEKIFSIAFFVLFFLAAGFLPGASARAQQTAGDEFPVSLYNTPDLGVPDCKTFTEKFKTSRFKGTYFNGDTATLEITPGGSYDVKFGSGDNWEQEIALQPGNYSAKVRVKTSSGGTSPIGDCGSFTVMDIPIPKFSVDSRRCQRATFDGQYVKGQQMTIEAHNETTGRDYTFTAVIEPNGGHWSSNASLSAGRYSARVKALNIYGQISAYSSNLSFTILSCTAEEIIIAPEEAIPPVKTEELISPEVAEQIKEFVGKKELQIITSAGAALSFLPFLLQFNALKDILILLRSFPGILFGAGKRRKEWGVVFSAASGRPIPFAVVNIFDAENDKKMDSTLSDKSGTYGILVPKGKYYLQVEKKKYEFLPKEVNLATSVIYYPRTYRGEILEYKERNIITYNLPMKPIAKEEELAARRKKLWEWLIAAIFYAGFVTSIVALIISPKLLNALIVMLYIISGALRNYAFGKIEWGSVTGMDGRPESFATVRIFDKESGELLARTISDESGRFFIVLDPGEYRVEASGVSDLVYKGSIKIKEKSLVKEKIHLRKE